jgi:hypothetical protein
MRAVKAGYGGMRGAGAPILILLAMAGTAMAAGPAALSPGVHVDPSSPAAKEYAIPLGQARGGDGSTSGQLFGSGITKAAGSSRTGAAAGIHSPASRSGTRVISSGHGAVVAQSPPADSTSAPSPDKLLGAGRGGTGIAWMLGAAAVVVALGVLGGAARARRNRGTRPRTS